MQLSQPTNKAINLNNYNMSSIHESNIKNIKDINHMNQMNMNMRNNNLQVPTPNYIQNTNSNIPQYIFNNNEGMMSINIEHRHIYDTRTINENNKRVNRKIEFTDNEVNNAPISSSMNQSQNIKLRNLNNFGGIISRKRVIETDEKSKINFN